MIKEFIGGQLANRCYLIVKDNKAVLVDAGDCYNEVKAYLSNNNITLIAVLLTHGHFDHACSAHKFQAEGIPIYIHKDDEDKLYTDNNLSYLLGVDFDYLKADYSILEGKLTIDKFEFNVISTPGHSKGSCAYVYGNHIFVGDTMFENGYGRYDLYDGDYNELMKSLSILQKYKQKNYLFYYGH